MRKLLFPLVPLIFLSAHAADTPKRSGGLFGFGASSSDQISGGLFPDANDGSTSLSSSATRTDLPRKGIEGIFRSGQPQKVEAVSYVIENGRRVERPVSPSTPVAAPISSSAPAPTTALQPLSAPVAAPVLAATEVGREKKKGFLGFGKKNDSGSDNPVVTPVPAAMPLIAANPVSSPSPAPKPAPPLAASPVVSASKPKKDDKPVEMANDVPVAVTRNADTPEFAGGTKNEKSGWLPSLPSIPFLNRHKNVDDPEKSSAPPASPALAATPVSGEAGKPAAITSSESSQPTQSSPASVAESTSSGTPTYEIRRDPSKPTEGKKDNDGSHDGLLNPIAKIRPPRKEKEIDLTGAETIIADGEIVARDNPAMLASTPESGSNGPRQAPQVVNGVKTYSSWDDVNASSSSAADKIISRIR